MKISNWHLIHLFGFRLKRRLSSINQVLICIYYNEIYDINLLWRILQITQSFIGISKYERKRALNSKGVYVLIVGSFGLAELIYLSRYSESA